MSNSKDLLKLTPKEFKLADIRRKEISAYVIDASISGCTDIEKVFEAIIEENKQIIITSITLEELNKVQLNSHDSKSVVGARHILRLAVENVENMFELRLINRNYTLADDCIIEYCMDNRDCCLLTSDKVMALKARMFGVECIYLSFEKEDVARNISKFKTVQTNLETLPYSENRNGELWLDGSKYDNNTLYQLCVDNNYKPMKNDYKIPIGSVLFEAKHVKDKVWNVSKYVVVNEATENNAEKVFSKEIALLENYSFEKTNIKFIDGFLRTIALIIKSNANTRITLPYTKFDKENNRLIANSHVTKGQAVLVYKKDKSEAINNPTEIEMGDCLIVISFVNEEYVLTKFKVTSICKENNCKRELKVEGFVKNKKFKSTNDSLLDSILSKYLPKIV